MKRYFLDIETRSPCDLKAAGGRGYAAHPETVIICAIVREEMSGEESVWCPLFPDAEAAPLGLRVVPNLDCLADGEAVGHNVEEFDRQVLERHGVVADCWTDTIHLLPRLGLPLSLDAAAKAVLGLGKDPLAKLAKRLCKTAVPLSWRGNMPLMLRYCLRDVRLVHALWDVLHLAEEAERARPETNAHCRVNDHGVEIDLELVHALLEADGQARLKTAEKVALVGLRYEDLRRRDFLLRWLRGEGANLGDGVGALSKDTVRAALPSAPSRARVVLEARLEVSETHAAKLHRLVSRGSPLRGMHRYCGAHTWRYSAVGVQTQNLASRDAALIRDPHCSPSTRLLAPWTEEGADTPGETIERFLGEGFTWTAILRGAIRRAFRARPGHVLVACDFAAIECRVLAWLAGEEWLLEAFRSGTDVYSAMATKLLRRPVTKASDPAARDLGKTIILGCGYSLGSMKLGRVLAASGIDTFGLTPLEIIEVYRDAHPHIAGTVRLHREDGRAVRGGGFWQNCAKAFKRAAAGEEVEQGQLRWTRKGDAVVVTLPSLRPIVYRRARVEGTALEFEHPRYGLTRTYGGKLAENIVQGFSRDLLQNVIEQWQDFVVLHVHDEVVVEVEASLGPWAKGRLENNMAVSRYPGLPLRGEARIMRRFGK